MHSRVLHIALGLAAAAMIVGATISTADWKLCLEHKGGSACNQPKNQATAAWTGFAMAALGFVTNTTKSDKNP